MAHQAIRIQDLPMICKVVLAESNPQPIVLTGSPGIAKTMFFKHEFRAIYAEHLGISVDQVGLLQIRVGQKDAAELAGVALPMKDENGDLITRFTKPPLITMIEDQVAAGYQYGVVLLDELLQAGADVRR